LDLICSFHSLIPREEFNFERSVSMLKSILAVFFELFQIINIHWFPFFSWNKKSYPLQYSWVINHPAFYGRYISRAKGNSNIFRTCTREKFKCPTAFKVEISKVITSWRAISRMESHRCVINVWCPSTMNSGIIKWK